MKKITKLLLLVTLMSTLPQTHADEKKRVQLFLMEKSHNEENIMVIHSQVNNECQFVGEKLIDYYWLMDGKKEKRVHAMIKKKIKERLKFEGLSEDKKSFKIQMTDLSEVKHDLDDINIRVVSTNEDGACKVQAILKLGPSKDHKEMVLDKTFCEVKKNLVRVPTGCKHLELIGKDLKTGEEIRVKFPAR